MKEWLTAREIADARLPGLPCSKRKVNALAQREGWATSRNADGRPLARKREGREGGGGFEYHVSLIDGWGTGGLVVLRTIDVEDVPLDVLVAEAQAEEPDALHILLTRSELGQLKFAAKARKIPSSLMATALLRYALNMAGALL